MKRQVFLNSFLGALGAVKILWTDIQADKIYGTVLYDLSNLEEKQDFVWHMTDENVPNENVKKLLDFLSHNGLIDIDKLSKPINEIKVEFLTKKELIETWTELFKIEVKIIDDGIETDSYFIHD